MSIETSNLTPDNLRSQSLIFITSCLTHLFTTWGKFSNLLESKSSIEKLTQEAVTIFAGADGNSYFSRPFNADFFNNNPKFKALLLLYIDELEQDSGASNVKGFIQRIQNDVKNDLAEMFTNQDDFSRATFVAKFNDVSPHDSVLEDRRLQLEITYLSSKKIE